jgi:hypothetical protein
MAYSTVADLLLGDIVLNPALNKQKAVDDAAEEMDSKLGWLYALPLAPVGTDPVTATSWEALPDHQVLLLKHINNKLASGRLVMALAMPGEQSSLHAYGWNLVKEATAELLLLANGSVLLEAIPLTDTIITSATLAPATINYDSESLLAGFENTVLRGTPWYSRPGTVP